MITKVENRDIKYPRIELRTGKLHFILPMNMKHHSIMNKYSDWISVKQDEISKALLFSNDLKLCSRKLDEVRSLITEIVDNYSKEYGLLVNRIVLRDLTSKWGSCSAHGNLTFNKFLIYLPEHHFHYVVYHETMHLIERKHTQKYWSIISEKYPRYKEIERELLSYWFAIYNKNKGVHYVTER
ncbi:MAG TPA: M48 family peptidase [Ignavibacteria bacterium]|nr:M48 family peptidase [Ignavibacteria bacterium]